MVGGVFWPAQANTNFLHLRGKLGGGGGILFVCRFLEVGNIFEVGAERGHTGKQNLALRH